jgi:hypothetical protein
MSLLRAVGASSFAFRGMSAAQPERICAHFVATEALRGTRAMAKTRRYSIVVRDEKSNTVVVTAAVDWTSDDKQIAVGHVWMPPSVQEIF